MEPTFWEKAKISFFFSSFLISVLSRSLSGYVQRFFYLFSSLRFIGGDSSNSVFCHSYLFLSYLFPVVFVLHTVFWGVSLLALSLAMSHIACMYSKFFVC